MKFGVSHSLAQRNGLLGFNYRLFSTQNKNQYNWLVTPSLVIAVVLAIVAYAYVRNHPMTNLRRVSASSQPTSPVSQIKADSKSVANDNSSTSTVDSTSSSDAKSDNSTKVTVNGKTVTVNGNGSYNQTTTTSNGQTSVSVNNSSTSSGSSSNNNSSVNVNVNSNSSN